MSAQHAMFCTCTGCIGYKRETGMKDINDIKNKEEARQYAIDYQDWASKEILSYDDLLYWQGELWKLARKYNLIREFMENGIL